MPDARGTGQWVCPICYMRYNTQPEAMECCHVPPEAPKPKPELTEKEKRRIRYHFHQGLGINEIYKKTSLNHRLIGTYYREYAKSRGLRVGGKGFSEWRREIRLKNGLPPLSGPKKSASPDYGEDDRTGDQSPQPSQEGQHK